MVAPDGLSNSQLLASRLYGLYVHDWSQPDILKAGTAAGSAEWLCPVLDH
jgi:hypothetical protein